MGGGHKVDAPGVAAWSKQNNVDGFESLGRMGIACLVIIRPAALERHRWPHFM